MIKPRPPRLIVRDADGLEVVGTMARLLRARARRRVLIAFCEHVLADASEPATIGHARELLALLQDEAARDTAPAPPGYTVALVVPLARPPARKPRR